MLRNRPRQRQPVIGARPPADLVQDHQRPLRGVVDDVGRLGHLHHEGGLAPRQFVAGADPRENPIDQPDLGAFGRDETARLRQQHQQGRLPDIGALAAHVRPGNDRQVPVPVSQGHVVGHELAGKLGLQHRMPALRNHHFLLLVQLRPAVVPLPRQLGQGRQHVDLRQGVRHLLQVQRLGRHLLAHLAEQLLLPPFAPLLGCQRLRLVLLQFISDVPLGVLDCLLPHEIGWHPLPVHMRDLHIIAEHLIEPHLQRIDTRLLDELPLILRQPGLAVPADTPQPVHLLVEAFANHAAIAAGQPRVRVDGRLDQVGC
ncbi:MAG: hypothetical protein BWY71_01435 [Planctomycetes bacterium ADurb.Bin412]|nr:MAG: hypothetical protein BWY71_01435 [Planctomycetes bacterium ADurb.Bin412]